MPKLQYNETANNYYLSLPLELVDNIGYTEGDRVRFQHDSEHFVILSKVTKDIGSTIGLQYVSSTATFKLTVPTMLVHFLGLHQGSWLMLYDYNHGLVMQLMHREYDRSEDQAATLALTAKTRQKTQAIKCRH